MTSTDNLGTVPLVDAREVAVEFTGRRGSPAIKAVDGVDLGIRRGEVLGLVGESGCGKSTLGRALIGLRELTTGEVRFDGTSLTSGSSRTRRAVRRRMQIVFQNPQASLNPRLTVGASIAEPLLTGTHMSRTARRQRVEELLTTVGLRPDMADRYPHEFSGGQRQRIAIARALSSGAEFVVCDEPISALDVSIQAQVLNLLANLRDELGLTYLFISHDLAVVRRLCTSVAVMYLGRIVEQGPPSEIYASPRHPYTTTLLSAVSLPDPARERARERILLRGDPPSPEDPPHGCSFHTRCWLYEQLGEPEQCRTERPELSAAPTRRAACHFADQAQERSPRPSAELHPDSHADPKLRISR